MSTAPKMYGVLDCSRSPELYEHAARLSPDSAACLFEGRLDESLKAVSPHVVELSPSDPLSAMWRTRGWGQAWGILFSSRADLATVRRHMRRFTQAKLPDGSGPVLFRFWDPRVFRVYMPLVEPGEVAAWFKDVDRYIVETEDGKGSLRFALQGGALSTDMGPPPAR